MTDIVPRNRVRLPDPGGHFKTMSREDKGILVELVAALQRELDTCVRTNSPRWELLLYAPDGSVWGLQVTNTGELTVTRPPKTLGEL